MLPEKKRIDHASDDAEENQQINFAWILLMGVQMGFSETDVKQMYFGKWSDLFQEYKKLHNFKVKKYLFKETKKPVSLLSL